MGLLLLVRHGQASFGSEDYDVLSEAGAAQGRRLGSVLAAEGVVPDVVVHGSMRRQRETAEAMAGAAGWRVGLRTDARWDEFDHLSVMAAHTQVVRDLDRRDFQAVFEAATGRWTAGEGDPATETFAGFVDRVDAALREVAGSVGSGETAVVVTSGGVIAAACGLLTLTPVEPTPVEPTAVATVWHRLNAVMVNASVTRVVVGGTGVRLLTFNEHAHLDRDQVTYR